MNTQSCLASLYRMTNETLQLHIKSVEKQLSGKKKSGAGDVQTFSYKVKDSRLCIWNISLPLESSSILWNICLNFRPSWSLLLVSGKLFFWSCLAMSTLMETVCLSVDAPQLLSWRFLARLYWIFLDGSYMIKQFAFRFHVLNSWK